MWLTTVDSRMSTSDAKLGTPAGAYRLSISLTHATLYMCVFPYKPISHSKSRYTSVRSISVWQLSCYIPSCHAHTCDATLITSVFAISIHTCESNANPFSRMYTHVIETKSCIHTCESNVNPMSWMYSHVSNQVIYITFITREHLICVYHMTVGDSAT